uniref:PDZ domain-containing protein n=1 Tax=Oryzias melastigma TaxID=30732 RepID=A0A3B3BRG5_ORYME
MTDPENLLERNGPPSLCPTSGDGDEAPKLSEPKKGPPVAPKPTWFSQSLRKMRDEELKSFGGRAAPPPTRMSIKQKIHSFENFSSPDGGEGGGSRRPVAPCTPPPAVEKEGRCASRGMEEVRFPAERQPDAQQNHTAPPDEPPRPARPPGLAPVCGDDSAKSCRDRLTDASLKPTERDSESASAPPTEGRAVAPPTEGRAVAPPTEGRAAAPQDGEAFRKILIFSTQVPLPPFGGLMLSTLQCLQDIHVVILLKEEGAGLGFSIAGGCDLESKAPTVHRVFPSGLAAQEGTIRVGDQLLSINGQALQDVTHTAATAALRLGRSLKLAVVVVYKRAKEVGGASGGEDAASAAEEQGALLSIELEKGAGGVDFTLEGGKGSIHGDRPLLVNRIVEGGAAEQSGLRRGDELLMLQGVELQDTTRFEAWNAIKALPPGPFTLLVRRREAAPQDG